MRHIVALSGGKDSTALALALKERTSREYEYICTPTGNELPPMLAHWDNLERILGQPIKRIKNELTLLELIEVKKVIPNWRMRYCTAELKIIVCQQYINSLQEPVTLYVGLRADEDGREGGEYHNCEVRFPFRQWYWTIEEVLAILKRYNICIPYRTDCAWCFFQRLPEWWWLWKDYPDIYEQGESLEIRMGHTFRSPSRDTWPASLRELRKRFEKGDIPRGSEKDKEISTNKCRVCSL